MNVRWHYYIGHQHEFPPDVCLSEGLEHDVPLYRQDGQALRGEMGGDEENPVREQ